MNRWKEYYVELFCDPDVIRYNQQDLQAFDADLPPLCTELKKGFRELKKAKAPGFDDVPAELLQADGDAAVDVLHRLRDTYV